MSAGGVGVVVAALATVLPAHAYLREPDIISIAAGLVTLSCGLAVIALSSARFGLFLVLVSLAWFAPDLAVTGHPAIDDAVARLALVHVGGLTHVIVAAGAKPSRPFARITIAVGWATAATTVTGGYDEMLPLAGGLLVSYAATAASRSPKGWAWWLSSAGLFGGAAIFEALLRLTGGAAAEALIANVHMVFFAASVALLAVSLTRRALQSADLTGAGVARVESILASELGVLHLRLALSDGSGGWLDVQGAMLTESPTGVVVTDQRTVPIAVISTSDALPVVLDGRLADFLALVAANAGLRRSISAQVIELDASRRRLSTADDVARSSLEKRLRTGALEDLNRLAGLVSYRVDLHEAVLAALVRLTDLANGLDPLAPDGALTVALGKMASRAPVPVRLTGVSDRIEPTVARAVWFVCAEAVANAAKHAPDSAVDITMSHRPGHLGVDIADDGPGGADRAGAGLVGMRDRVEALGGRLAVRSDKSGTALSVDLPVADHHQD